LSVSLRAGSQPARFLLGGRQRESRMRVPNDPFGIEGNQTRRKSLIEKGFFGDWQTVLRPARQKPYDAGGP
jgi:hypothetical protein